MIETSCDVLVLSLAGYVALTGHGFALPCYRRAKGGNAWYTAECSPPGDHAGTIVFFEIYASQGVVELPPDQQRLVAVGDPWQNVFLWNGQVLVGRPDEVWAATEPFRSEIADAAPLSLLDAAACVDSAERDRLAQASFAFMNDRYGPAKAKDWRDRIYLRGKALLIVRSVLGSLARQDPIRRALREITVCEVPGGVLQMNLSGRLLAELNSVSDIANILGDLREHTAAFSMDVRVKDETRPLKPDPENNPADNDDLYRTLHLALIEAEKTLGPEHPDTIVNNLAALYYEQARYEDGDPLYTRAVAMRKKVLGPHHSDTATSLSNLDLAHASLGETQRTIDTYEQALGIAREIGDRRGEGHHLVNLGLAHAALGEIRRAIDFHQHALAIAREIGDRRGEGRILGNLGLAHADLGDTRRAIDFYEQALVIAREIGDRRGEGRILGKLGLAHADLGETWRAIDFHQQALVIAREIGDRLGEERILGDLGL
ncbi:tetratricopeptide repeat protein, partial [Azospirillum sp.]|uniref:tetratricopeptide repeat protein n=1 Tax=Azospirillum sp. TaxID=34012 RepID=UPI00260EFAB3